MKRFGVLSLTLGLQACAPLGPVPTDTFYRLDCPVVAGTSSGSLAADAILVRRFASSGVHMERALIYTDAAGLSLKQHSHHFWIDSPTALLQDCLVRSLREAGAAQLVVTDRSVPVDVAVGGRIVRFEQVVSGTQTTGKVTLELSVTQRDAAKPLLLREYSRDVPAAGTGIPQSVEALASAVGDIYREFVSDAAKIIARDRQHAPHAAN